MKRKILYMKQYWRQYVRRNLTLNYTVPFDISDKHTSQTLLLLDQVGLEFADYFTNVIICKHGIKCEFKSGKAKQA